MPQRQAASIALLPVAYARGTARHERRHRRERHGPTRGSRLPRVPSQDTQSARDAAAAAILEVANEPAYGDAIDLRLFRWDDQLRHLALCASHNPQRDIEQQLSAIGDCHLVIALFSHTMGGVLDEGAYGRSPLDRPWHCAEWEVNEGLKGLSGGTVETVMIFRDMTPQQIPPELPLAERKVLQARDNAVAEYFEWLNPSGDPMWAGVNEYTGSASIADELKPRLRQRVELIIRQACGQHGSICVSRPRRRADRRATGIAGRPAPRSDRQHTGQHPARPHQSGAR
jgi:hypothetical protein